MSTSWVSSGSAGSRAAQLDVMSRSLPCCMSLPVYWCSTRSFTAATSGWCTLTIPCLTTLPPLPPPPGSVLPGQAAGVCQQPHAPVQVGGAGGRRQRAGQRVQPPWAGGVAVPGGEVSSRLLRAACVGGRELLSCVAVVCMVHVVAGCVAHCCCSGLRPRSNCTSQVASHSAVMMPAHTAVGPLLAPCLRLIPAPAS